MLELKNKCVFHWRQAEMEILFSEPNYILVH